MNHTAVVSPSVAHYEAARAAQVALRDYYDTPSEYRPSDGPQLVAGLHQAINYGLKSAEVCALAEIAENLRQLVAAVGQVEARA